MSKILIIEDDPNLGRLLQLELEQSSYLTALAVDGLDGLRQFHDMRPNLVVLDIALPKMDGLSVCQRIREFSNVPILILTAHAISEEDIAKGLDLGADEYLLKPFRHLEFQARIKALLRRAGPEAEPGTPLVYTDPHLTVDLEKHQVFVKGQEVKMTPTEFKLLSIFVRNRGRVISFQQLLEQVWGYEYTTENHYPRIYVSHLRHKIEPNPESPTYIQNEYGVGYRFMDKH